MVGVRCFLKTSKLTFDHVDKEGPIHDVTWNPNSKEFGVIYGYMPAKTTIFDTKANATHNFSLAPRNTILFSPNGRLVLVAGFGNLAGQLDIYDLQKDYAKVATIEASNASVCEWSPDGKHILTATTSPRLRVDNGIKIWHVGGGLMYKDDMNELYTVTWRPQSTVKHPAEDPLHPAPAPHASALAYLGTVKTPSKPAGAYRPPGARGTLTPLHFKREDEGGIAYVNNGISSTSGGSGINGFGKPKRREVPGAETVEALPPGAAPGGGVSLTPGEGDENLSKAALKNKKKREAKKAKDAAEKNGVEDGESNAQAVPEIHTPRVSTPDAGANRQPQRREGSRTRKPRAPPGLPAADPQSNLPSSSPVKAAQSPPKQKQAAPVQSPAASQFDLDSANNGGSPHEKKVRALLKKLRAIDDLKMRQAGGEKLELSQVSKIRTEDSVRKELDALGGGG